MKQGQQRMAAKRRTRHRRFTVAVLAAAVLAGCGSSAKTGAPPTSLATSTIAATTTTATSPVLASTPEDAIRAYLATRDHAYIGDCSKSRVPADIGKYCSLLKADSGARRSYLVGPVASEGDIVVVVRDARGWRVVSVSPTPPLAP